MLGNVRVIIALSVCFLSSLAWTAYDPILEPELRLKVSSLYAILRNSYVNN